MQFMSQVPFESFLLKLFLESIELGNTRSTKFHYVCPDPDKAKKLFNARLGVLNTKNSSLIIDDVTVPVVEAECGLKLIIMLHDSAAKEKETYSEDFIANVRDAINNLENTSLFVIHNSALETILTSCQDISVNKGVFTPEYVQNQLDKLAQEHKHTNVIEAIAEKQKRDVEEQNLSVFGYEALYNSIINNETKFQQHGLFQDSRLLAITDKKAIKNDINKNGRLYTEIEAIKNDHLDENSAKEKFEKLGFGEKFTKDNFLKGDKWKELEFSVLESEIENNKTRKLTFEQLEVNGQKHKHIKAHDTKCKVNSILIEAEAGPLEIKVKYNKGDTLLKMDEVKVVGDYALSRLDPRIGNHEKYSILTTNFNYDGSVKLFQIKLNRTSGPEKIQLNVLLIPKNTFPLINIWEKITIEFNRNKGQVNLDNVTEPLVFNEELHEALDISAVDSKVDLLKVGKVNFLPLLEAETASTATLCYEFHELPVHLFGKASLEKIKLPSILDESRVNNIYSLDGQANYKTESQRVVYLGKEKELSVSAKGLCRIEAEFIDSNLLYKHQTTDEQLKLSDLKEINPILAESYQVLYNWLASNNTILSLTSWPVELQVIVESLLEQFEAALNSIPENSLSTHHKALMKVGMYHGAFEQEDDATDWLTPFHPMVLSYLLQLVKQNNDGNKVIGKLPKVTIDKLTPAGLLPVVYDANYDYAYSRPASANRLWLQIVPQKQSNQSYVAKLVQEKLNDFIGCFNMLFERNQSTPVLINSIHNQKNEYVFEGIVDYYRRNKEKALRIHISLYDDRLHNTAFDSFTESTDINVLRKLVRKKESEKVDETDALINLVKSKLIYSKQVNQENYAYAHISFFKNNEKVKLVDKAANSANTGVGCNGLIAGEASYLENENYYTGFGVKGLEKLSAPVRFALKYNSLFKPFRDNTASYNPAIVPALAVKDTFRQSLNSIYSSSIWTCIVDPKVTLEFFDDKDTILIHYSDKYTNCTGYDAITISTKTDLYRGLLKESSTELVNSFNAISGQWLLDVVKTANKPQTVSVQNQLKEKQGIVAAYKFVSGLLAKSDITWVPLSIAELIRVTGNLGLKISESDFSARLQNKKLKVMSDDLLLVGFKQNQMYLLPLEVKTRETGNDFSKAMAQAVELKSFMSNLLSGNDLKAQIYRTLFVQHVFAQVERFELYKLFPENYFETLVSKKEFYQQGQYELCDVEGYVDGFAIAFKNDLKTARTNPKVDKATNILTIEISFGWMRFLQSNSIELINDKLTISQELPELTKYTLFNTVPKLLACEPLVISNDYNEGINTKVTEALQLDSEYNNDIEICDIESSEETEISWNAQFGYPAEFEELITLLCECLKCDLTKEDLFALTESDFLGLVNDDNTYLLPFYRLKDFLNSPIEAKNKTSEVFLKDLLIDQEFNALANFIIRSFGEEVTVEQVTELKETQMLALNGFGKGKLEKFNEFKQKLADDTFAVAASDEATLLIEDYDIDLARLEIELINSLQRYFETAKERDKQIFTRRLGINTQSETLEEIGQDFGVTRERIRQIEVKAKKSFLAKLTVSQKVIKAVVQSNLSELREPLFPQLRHSFTNQKQFYMFLELCCGLEENEIQYITNPSLSRDIFNEFWIANKSPAPLEDVIWYLHENADIDLAVAENQILRWQETGHLELDNEYVKPLKLPKVETIVNTLLDFPNGVAWQLLQQKAEEKGISANEMLLDRLEPGIGSGCDRELIYQCGRGTYRHLCYLHISDQDIQYILTTVKSKLQEYKHTNRDAVNLSVDICDQTRFVHDYFVIRYVVRTFGETAGIYFKGKSGADTVSLNSEFSLASQRSVLVSVFKDSLTPLNKQDVASRIRSNSLGHAAFYMDILLTEGVIVRIDENKFAHVDNAFKGYNIEEIMQHAAVFIEREKDIIEGESLQTYLNRKLELQLNKYFYISLLKVHSGDFGLSLYFVQNLVSKVELQEKGLADFCRQALLVTDSNAGAIEWVKSRICVYDHVVKRVLSQVANTTKREQTEADTSETELQSKKLDCKINVEESHTLENFDIEVPQAPAQVSTLSSIKSNVEPFNIEHTRVLIGRDLNTNEDIYWEYGNKALANRHLIVFGRSGQGKTYCIQALLSELARVHVNSLVVDYTNGFLPEQLEKEFKQLVNPKTDLIVHAPIDLNPFKKQKSVIAGIELKDKAHDVATRVASVFNSVFSSIGEQQLPTLIRVIEEGIELYGADYNFNKMLKELEEHDATGAKLANKLMPIVKANIFACKDNENGWQAIFEDKESVCRLIQMANLSRDVWRAATEFILWDLYAHACLHGNKTKPLPVVLDEVQNLDHRLDSPLAKILTEGRKYGLSLILATQTLSNLKKEEQDRLFQAAHKLFFAPAETEADSYAKLLEQAVPGTSKKYWANELATLQKGECISVGLYVDKEGQIKQGAKKVQVTALGERT